MDSVIKGKEEAKEEKYPKTFLSKAFIMELDKNMYGLYRQLIIEDKDSNGLVTREKKGAPIGPIGLLREMQKGEEQYVVSQTFDEQQHRVIYLVPMKEPQ